MTGLFIVVCTAVARVNLFFQDSTLNRSRNLEPVTFAQGILDSPTFGLPQLGTVEGFLGPFFITGFLLSVSGADD